MSPEEPTMTRRDVEAVSADSNELERPLERLLFVADAAVADMSELPTAVRALIAAATDVYVVTPTLPGRLAWLADDVDRFRHIADERLDTVLAHMREIGAHATGVAGRGSVLRVIADAVEQFGPDHILIALRDSDHANWQERRLIAHIEERFGLPLTTYAVDLQGHTSTADGPLILCYDGSAGAADAIQQAGALFPGSRALVLTVWQSVPIPGSLGMGGEPAPMVDNVGLDRAAAERGARLADEGARIARDAGLRAKPLAVKAPGAIWESIVDLANRHDAATIVMGSRGVTGIRAMLLGSVSNAVVHHADRPTLIVRSPTVDA
jgi:nucleotide-binding universal stress UspA family protein